MQGPSTGIFAWQGLKLEVPSSWNPLKLEGDYDNGYALIADLHRPRLGVRWITPARKKFDARRALVEEVGVLAADEAQKRGDDREWRDGLLYIEPDPPGRDVWVAQSKVSNRTIELVHHVQQREREGIENVQATLEDVLPNEPVN